MARTHDGAAGHRPALAGHRAALADRQVTIGGRSYTLRFSIRAIAALQDHYQLSSFEEVQARLQDRGKVGSADIAAVLWALLRRHHPEVSLEQAVDLADDLAAELGMEGLGAIFGAVNAGLPEGGAEGERRHAARPRKRSGRQPPSTAG